MDHSSVRSGAMKPCVTCDKNSMLHNGGTFDGSDITRISVNDFPLSSANTTRFFDLKYTKSSNCLFSCLQTNSHAVFERMEHWTLNSGLEIYLGIMCLEQTCPLFSKLLFQYFKYHNLTQVNTIRSLNVSIDTQNSHSLLVIWCGLTLRITFMHLIISYN